MARAVVAVASFGVVLTSPAVGAELIFRKTDSLDQVIDALEGEGSQVQVATDVVHHVLVFLGIRVGVLVQICVFAFLFADIATSDQVVHALGTGEVDELTGVNQRRASDTHMGFLTAHGVKLFSLLTELSTADDGVVAEHQALVVDETRNRNELHGCHVFTLTLVLRHKGTCPGRSVLHEGACKLDASFVCIAQGVRSTGVRNTASGISFGGSTLSKCGTATVAGHFHIAAFVGGCWIAVVNPQEGADGHLLAGFDQSVDSFGSEFCNFAGAQIAEVVVAQVRQRAAFLHGDDGTILLAHDDGSTAPLVAGGVELAVAVHDENGAATLDLLLYVVQAFDDGVLGGDQCGDHFGRADHTAGGRILELHAVVLEQLVLQVFDVGNKTDGHQGEGAVLAGHYQRLRIGIRNDAQAHVASELCKVVFELTAERSVLDVVNGTMEIAISLQNSQASAVSAQMRMIVGSEEQIGYAIVLGNNATKAAHKYSLEWEFLRA